MKNKKQQQSKKQNESAELETPEEEILPSEEIENDDLELEEEQEPLEDEIPETIESEELDDETPDAVEPDASVEEIKPVGEVTEITGKQKIKALKRAIDNKNLSLDRERVKVKEWRQQAKDRNDKALTEFEKRKKELEEALEKNQKRFDARIAKTQKWWIEYSDEYEINKIQKIEADIALLKSELEKIDEKEPAEA